MPGWLIGGIIIGTLWYLWDEHKSKKRQERHDKENDT